MSKEDRWYLIVEDDAGRRQEGPVSTEYLSEEHSAGRIASETLVWHDGMTDWEQIGTIEEFALPMPQSPSPADSAAETTEPLTADSSRDVGETVVPSDAVTLKEFASHSVRFSKSRNVLVIAAGDYHAGPLELTKLDLLGFLTAMESSTLEE